MGLERGRFQGIKNIIYFNWHFYIIFLLIVLGGINILLIIPFPYAVYLKVFLWISTLSTLVSLIVSWLLYDQSDLYRFHFVKDLTGLQVLNIHAGFDESSAILKEKSPSLLAIADFYDPQKHTEISIKRARKMYPNREDCIPIKSNHLPFENNYFDRVFLIFSAHEIRNREERKTFLKELLRILHPDGEVLLLEHRRDWKNFLVYNIGFFHFYSEKEWLNNFKQAGFKLEEKQGIHQLITAYKFKKNGSTA